VNCLKAGCRSLFIAAVEYFGPGTKFEGLKELEIPYKRTKMDNSIIVYIIRLYIYLKESPEITKALLAIEATINPGATAIDYGVFRIPFYLGYLSERMEYDAGMQVSPICQWLADVNNLHSKPAETVPPDGEPHFSFHVSKPGFYRMYFPYMLGEGMVGAMSFVDENSSKRKRD
jgi:hypothetical protein